jgi:transglutaminase-like putative cysteine protease
MPEDLTPYLAPGRFVDSDHPAVVAWATRVTEGATTPRERAVKLYYAVRDGLRYDPYAIEADPEAYKASHLLTLDRTFCVPKAILCAAGARAVGIPARLSFADVRNHLSSEALVERMGTDVFAFHGYVELYLEGRWLRVTPTFNKGLCAFFGVAPMEFDGTADALFHAYDGQGKQFMEYVRERGTYVDFPFEEMRRVFRETYPSSAFVADGAHDDAFRA